MTLDKKLPVASGIGGGSADAAAALRLLTSLWRIDPAHARAVAPTLGSDVPACLLSLPMRGEGAGDQLTPVDLPELSGTPVLLVNPRVPLSTAEVFARWDGDRSRAARRLARGAQRPRSRRRSRWCRRSRRCSPGSARSRARSSSACPGSGATCFALFDSEEARDAAADAVPREWWRLATFLR